MPDETSIAIIGLAGRFPKSANLDEFWANLRQGRECFTWFTDDELRDAGVSEADLKHPNYVKSRAVLEDAGMFDASFFGYNRREAELLDPQQRVFLECAHEALEHAGYGPGPGHEPQAVGVFAGTSASTYLLSNLLPSRALEESVGNLQVMIGNDKDYLAPRVSYKLNLTGPSFAVQTACSTSLVAVHQAVQSLLGGECAMALAGGVCISLPQVSGYYHQEGGIASPDGHCRPFDADAHGTNGGSGVGVVLLKRLPDALDDGDTIHAIIRGSAVNNDGANKVGFTAPSQTGQANVIAEALAVAGASAETISYVEAHGTATAVGDPIEVAALTQAFRESTAATGFCALGSVKSNFGHLDAAAGIAGLLKTVLALRHREIPPSLNYKVPNPKIRFGQTPFFVAAQGRSWRTDGAPRRAGVSSFGIGGTNAHVVLEESPQVAATASDTPELLVFSARTATSLDNLVKRFAEFFDAHPETPLADAAHTLQLGRGAWEYRRAIVACSGAEAARLLREPFDPMKIDAGNATETPVAFAASGGGVSDRLATLGQSWERGVPVDWKTLPRGTARPRRIPLPTYAFERQRCWIEPKQTAAPVTSNLLDALYVPRWRPVPPSEEPIALRQVVYFDPETELSAGILRELQTRGCEVTRAVRGAEPVDASGLETADAILYAWPLRASADSVEEDPAIEWSFHALMRLGKTLSGLHREALLRVTVLADGVADVSSSDRVDPAQSCVLGAVRELPKELPWLKCKCIDVQLQADPVTVVGEIMQAGEESAVALRGKERFAWMLEPVGGSELKLQSLPLRNAGVYWIVGGFGGLGLVVARFLASRYRAKLVLTSRSVGAAKPVELPVADWRRRLVELQAASGIVPMANRGDLPEQLTEYSAARVFEYFQTAGLPLEAGASVAPDELAKRLAVQPAFGKFFAFMCALLVRTGVGARQATELKILRTPPSSSDLRAKIEGTHAGFGGMLYFIEHCTNQYPQALSGALPGIAVLYPDGSAEKMEQAVDTTVEHSTVRIQLQLLAETVKTLAKTSAGAPLQILEAGGGHGIVTDALLPQLGDVEYWFTDISKAFVEKRRHLAETAGEKRLVAATLDISRDPLRQGFAAGQFDVVLAMNVVHATASVGATLGHLRTLLKPGGVIVLLETVRREPWVDLVWGLAPGWWSFEDARTDSPLLTAVQWHEAFEGSGFSDFSAFPDGEENAFVHDAALLIARKPADAAAAERRQEAVTELETLGAEVLALPADVADEKAMASVVRQTKERFGALHGVFHSALHLEDRLLVAKTREQAERVLQPKIAGTLVLDRILADTPLDFLVLFSSLAGFDPAPGQFDYAAASAFMDAYARARRGGTRRVLSIDWNRWRDSGFVARLAKQSAGSDGEADRTVVLSAARHWFLAEHRIDGVPLVPGTAYLEMAVTTGLGQGLSYPLQLDDVQLLALCQVPEGEEQTLRVNLAPKKGASGYSFEIATDGPLVCGHIAAASVESAPSYDFAQWKAECRVAIDQEVSPRPAALGSRWQALSWAARNEADTKAFAEIALPEALVADLESHPLHPALLDVATGFGCATESLPFGYDRVIIRGPIPAHFFSLAEIVSEGGDAVINVSLTDADGREFIRIDGYRLRGIKQNRCLQLGEPGQIDTLGLVTVNRPSPATDEVEIEVVAAGLNFKDVLYAAGLLPADDGKVAGFGAECAGRIVRVGAAAAGKWSPGDEVIAATTGAMANYAIAKAAHVFAKPATLSFAAAATIPVAYATAWYALKSIGQMTAGQKVLIHAATGGVGLAAVQIAQRGGAEIFATAGSEQKRDHLRSLGVEQVMDSRSRRFVEEIREKTQGAGVDLVLNSLAGDLLQGGLECVARGGLFLELGKRDILGGGQLPLALFNKGIGFVAIELSPDLPAYRGVVGAILEDLAGGKLSPLPSQLFAWERAGEAFQRMLAAKHIGKLVLTPDPARAERTSLGGRRGEALDAMRSGLSDEEGLRILQLALQLPEPQIVVSTEGNPLRRPEQSGTVAGATAASSPQTTAAQMPQGDVVKTLTIIWREALGVQQVGPDDDFFDLLGDSLLAIDVLAKIKTQLNVALPPSTLFTTPTIRGLTALIESKTTTGPRKLPKGIVPLHRGKGTGTPVFFAAPILGTLFPYVPLAQILGRDRPIYGLSPRGDEPGEEPFESIPELAAYAVAGMRAVHPQGPYMVSGWSFGATVAFEVARQLEEQGQSVALLAPIDLPAPSASGDGWLDFVRFFGGAMARNILSYTRDYFYLKVRPGKPQKRGFLWPLLERAVIARAIPPEARESFAAQPNIRELLKLYKANIEGLSAYPSTLTCNGRIDLYRTQDHNKRRHSEALGWEKSTRGTVVVHHMPADHMTILRPAHVQALADAMNERIKEIEGSLTQP